MRAGSTLALTPAFSLGGLYVADYLEKAYPEHNNRTSAPEDRGIEPHLAQPTEGGPRLFSISVVDRERRRGADS